VPYSQRYLFNAISDTNRNANPTNPNRNSKGNQSINQSINQSWIYIAHKRKASNAL